MAVEMNLDSLLDKEYETKTLAEILKAPVSALAGVSDGDAQHLKGLQHQVGAGPGEEQVLPGRAPDHAAVRGGRQVGRPPHPSPSKGGAYRNRPPGIASAASDRTWKNGPHSGSGGSIPTCVAAVKPKRR